MLRPRRQPSLSTRLGDSAVRTGEGPPVRVHNHLTRAQYEPYHHGPMDHVLATTWATAVRTLVHVGSRDPETGIILCMGTGVIASPTHVITAQHIVDEVAKSGKHLVAIAVEYGPTQVRLCATWRRAERAAQVEATDMAVITTVEAWDCGPRSSYDVAAVHLSPAQPEVGSIVDAYGHPPTLLNGLVALVFAGITHLRRYVVPSDPGQLWCTQPNVHGMSGGPLFDLSGNLVGIASATLVQPESMMSTTTAITGYGIYIPVAPHFDKINELMKS
jgi:Trypsin-like peptidase domain